MSVTHKTQISQGWSAYTAVLAPGDFDGDGHSDLIARTSDGRLLLYRGNGYGGFYGATPEIGHGFGSYTALVAPGDFDGDGHPDIVGRTSSGALYGFRSNGTGGFKSGYVVISTGGWQGFSQLF